MPHVERINKELKRRSKVVGAFPNDTLLLRLAVSIMIDINEEWITGRRYLSMELELCAGCRVEINYRKSGTGTRSFTTAPIEFEHDVAYVESCIHCILQAVFCT